MIDEPLTIDQLKNYLMAFYRRRHERIPKYEYKLKRRLKSPELISQHPGCRYMVNHYVKRIRALESHP